MRKLAAFLALFLLLSVSAQAISASTPLDGDSEKAANIRLAASAFDHIEVQSGETFSFNALVGERSVERGYVDAVNGRGAIVLGGGVGQVASTLYLALQSLNDIAFDDLRTYGSRFTDSYTTGYNAVIVDYANGVDFVFKNKGEPMTITMSMTEDALTCDIDRDESVVRFAMNTDARTVSVPCGDNAIRHNADIAADSIMDTTLLKGNVFSFNAVVGPREKEYGFIPALNGRGVSVVGGGVARVASALWLAIQDREDFAITSKKTYGERYNQDYVERSGDAILVDYSAGTDFCFKYIGDGSATIFVWLEGDDIRCAIETE